MRALLLSFLVLLGAPSATVAQWAGQYEVFVALDGGEPNVRIGFLVLAPGPFLLDSLPERFRAQRFQRSRRLLLSLSSESGGLESLEPNACFWLPDAPRSVEDREFYAGIIELGVSKWEEAGDSIRVPVYRSPDASAHLVGTKGDSGFAGHIWQADFDMSRSGAWLPFSAVKVNEWKDGSCSELVSRAGWGGPAG